MASQVAQCLSATLSSDPNARIAAELKLNELSANPETGLVLAQLVLAQDLDLALRQMSSLAPPSPFLSKNRLDYSASIVLRKYVQEHWSPFFSQFKGGAPPVEVKTQIRRTVFQGLSDPLRKVRTASAHTLSSIANCDWPDEYPDLLNNLIDLISSNSPHSVHGSLQVFVEFIKADLTEDQILPVLRQLLPVLLNILGDAEHHSNLTRSRTISVFNQCVESLFMVKDQHPNAVQEATTSILPVWLDAFKVLLSIDPKQEVENTQNWDGLAIRIQIYKTLDNIFASFARALTPYLTDLLSASLHHLEVLLPTFYAHYIACTDSVPPSSEDETINLTQLICPLFDFISNAARGGKAKDWFNHTNLTAVITSIFNWAQLSNDDEEEWASNANAFVAQDADDAGAYSVRMAGFDLLSVLVERTPATTTSTIQTTLQQIITNSSHGRDAGQEPWWRPLEAALAACGSVSEDILECLEEEEECGRPKPIDIEYFLTNIIPNLLGLSRETGIHLNCLVLLGSLDILEYPFLQGRAFVFASQYTKVLPAQVASQYLNAAIQVLESSDSPATVRLSAVKAIQKLASVYILCDDLIPDHTVYSFYKDLDDSLLLPVAPRIAGDLGPLLLMTSEDTLALVLETLSVILTVQNAKWLTTDLSRSIVSAVLQVWVKFNKDPIFLSILTDILSRMTASHSPGVYETIVKESLPPLAHAIASAPTDESWIASAAIELVGSLVQGAPTSNLGDGFFGAFAPSLFQKLKTTEDRDIIQNGIVTLTWVVRKDVKQVINWTDHSTGESGLGSTLSFIAQQLQSEDESGGLVIGDLIIHLLRNAGDGVLPVLPQFLHTMVGRMTTAKTATFVQSLIIPFAFLIYNQQRDTVLSLLETTNINGRSGLDILIQTWCENAETFQGFWAIRISNLALSSLFASERPSLQTLMVKGDIILKPETKNVIMTRSRTKQTPPEFRSIPFPVKALKLLLHDLQTGGESAVMGLGSNVSDLASDDGDDDWEEEDTDTIQGSKPDEFAFLSDLIGPKGANFDNDEILGEIDDEDLRADPVSQIDMKDHLLGFLRECAARNTSNFSVVVDQLTPEEILVVRNAVLSGQR